METKRSAREEWILTRVWFGVGYLWETVGQCGPYLTWQTRPGLPISAPHMGWVWGCRVAQTYRAGLRGQVGSQKSDRSLTEPSRRAYRSNMRDPAVNALTLLSSVLFFQLHCMDLHFGSMSSLMDQFARNSRSKQANPWMSICKIPTQAIKRKRQMSQLFCQLPQRTPLLTGSR